MSDKDADADEIEKERKSISRLVRCLSWAGKRQLLAVLLLEKMENGRVGRTGWIRERRSFDMSELRSFGVWNACGRGGLLTAPTVKGGGRQKKRLFQRN